MLVSEQSLELQRRTVLVMGLEGDGTGMVLVWDGGRVNDDGADDVGAGDDGGDGDMMVMMVLVTVVLGWWVWKLSDGLDKAQCSAHKEGGQ